MYKNSKNNVYTDVEVQLVPSMHNDTTNYRVCYGYVDWDRNGELRPAVYILMEYKGYVKYNNPPHILTTKGLDGKSDLESVLEKVEMLRNKYNI